MKGETIRTAVKALDKKFIKLKEMFKLFMIKNLFFVRFE